MIEIIGLGLVAAIGLITIVGFSFGVFAVYVAMKEVHEEY